VKEDEVVSNHGRLRLALRRGERVGGRGGGRGEDAEAADVSVDIQLQGGTDGPVVLCRREGGREGGEEEKMK